MDRLTYRELLNRLKDADAWLCDQGLKQQFDRMRVNKRNLAFLADTVDDGTLERKMEEAGDERRRELMWSLAESTEFVDSLKSLRDQGCEVPFHVIKTALHGPVDLRLESPTSNDGRNAMFEIAIAGRFARSGLKPILGGEPDVLVELHGRRLLIQCKRVFSENGILRCFLDANKQLKRDLRSCNPRDCGVIAVSISRVFNQGDKILTAANEATLRQRLRDEIDEVRRNLTKDYRHVGEPKIAGVLYHLSTPAMLEDIGLYMAAHSITVDSIPGKSDHSLLTKLTNHL